MIGRVCYMKMQNFFFVPNNLYLIYAFQCLSLHESIWGYRNGNSLEYKGKSLMLFGSWRRLNDDVNERNWMES